MLWPTISKFAFTLLYLHVSGSESAEQKRGVRVHFRCHAVFIEIKNTVQDLITNVNFIVCIQIDPSSSIKAVAKKWPPTSYL